MSEIKENCNVVYNQEETEISIASIIALGFNKIKGVLIALCLGLVLLGGWKFISTKNVAPVQIENPEETQTKLEALEEQLANYEIQEKAQSLYNDNAPVMKIDPANAVKTIIIYGVDNNSIATNDGKIVSLSSFVTDTYVSYLKVADLQTAIKSSLPNEWLREVISVSSVSTADKTNSSSIFQVTIYADTKENADAIANAMNSFIKERLPEIKALSYEHTLREISRTQTIKYEKSIADKQINALNALSEIVKNIDAAKKEIKNVTTPPAPVAFSYTTVVKWAAIGAVLGAFLYCLYLLIRFISKVPVTSSNEVEERTGLQYLGSYYRKRSWNKKIADSLLNERVFASSDAAASFAVENIKSIIPAKQNVLLVSSFYKDEKAPEVAIVMDILKKAGCNATFTGNALVSADFVSELSKTDSIIILEEKWRSQWRNIYSVLQVISRKEKKAVGFILA
ncbi:MAG: hypothetical protein J5747_07485 [Spirochaetaceae bacterium]|nr:hypothetical protein [Spirochaetaceae bacterium]